MAITAYADLLPSMRMRLPDCNDETIEQALWLAGREFCRDSEAYIVTLTSIDGVDAQKPYTLTIPTQFDPLRVTEVRVLTEDEVTDGDKGRVLDPSKYDFHFASNVLEFFTAPFSEDITSGLVVMMALAPEEDEDDTELDFEWVRRWSRYIKAGAYYHLFTMPKSTWASDAEAGKALGDYLKGVSFAKREVYVKGTSRQLRMAQGTWL